jgi:hypothetical protein
MFFTKFSYSFFVIPLLFLTKSLAQHSDLFINEFMASNELAYENSYGDYVDWIEIYNTGNSDINLAGYYLTDDLEKDTYWKIQSGQSEKTTISSKGYLLLFADEMTEKGNDHLDFKLSSEEGKIFLIDKDGISILDSIYYGKQFRDISYGCSPDAGEQWGYQSDFTAGESNKEGFPSFVLPPVVDQSAGFYSNVNVTIQPASSGDIIRYTLDGSDPMEESAQYVSPIPITQTSIVKARSFRAGFLPSEIVTKTFLIAEHNLPVLALITDPENLFDPATGIYVNDNDGKAWERFGELEYFKNNSLGFHISTGLRIQGNTGPRDFNKKSFRAFFRKGYGKERLVYQLYPDNTVASFSKLVLRAGYDDSLEPTLDGSNSKATLIRDPLVAGLWQKLGGLSPQDHFTVLYLNNSYHGIYDIKESIDESFVRDHMGYRDVDIIRTRWDFLETVYGDQTKWNEMIDFFQSNSFEDDDKIEQASQFLDLNNYINLQALIYTTQYSSWAYGVFVFREKSAGALWQWTVWDADRSYSNINWDGFISQSNPTAQYLDEMITKKLLQNQTFKIGYINRIADLLNTTLSSDSQKSIIDALADHIENEIPNEVARWNNTAEKWHENIDSLRAFADVRPSIVRQQMQSYFNLGGKANITLEISGKGKILVNTIMLDKFPWSGIYFSGIPIKLTAIPESGYKFSGWGETSLPDDTTITLNISQDTVVSAIFIQQGSSNVELITPKRIKQGQHLPIVVRIRDANGNINPVDQTPVTITFGGAHTDTVIAVKRGAGTGHVQVNAASSFMLSVQNDQVAPVQRQIEISSVPSISYSGILPAGNHVWNNTADHLITGDLTIPEGCNLTVKKGTWILLKKYVNIFIEGELTIEGTSVEPVVITSDNWAEPWGGMEFRNALGKFEYCMMLNGGGDPSKGYPTNDGWHTGRQHIIFGRDNSELTFNQCFFLYSPGKVFGVQDGKVTVRNSVTSFVWHGGEFHRVLLFYEDSHIMNLPNDDHIYTEDIDTDGFHIDYVNPNYPQFSVINNCYFITGKDDAIDQHSSRLRISNCWLEDFIHEGVAASGSDTVIIFNTVALNNDQGFEAGNTDSNRDLFVFIDHSVAVGNNVGLRIGDSYSSSNYNDIMKVSNSVLYNNDDNIWNYLYSTQAPVEGALEISYSMTNDSDYDTSRYCITEIPQFDPYYYLTPGSPGINMGLWGTNMGRADSSALSTGAVVINEIMYNAPAEMDSKDWIELYNPQPANQDISDWILKDENDAHEFIIPSGTIIPAKGYWVICEDTSSFKQIYPSVNSYTGNFPFGFGGKDQVRLFTSAGQIVDSISYENEGSWPKEADGEGYSLVLLDPAKDHTLSSNWSRSGQFGGSPGRQNFITEIEEDPRGETVPTNFILEQNYPNPFNSHTVIRFSLPQESQVELEVFNLLGERVAIIFSGRLPAGNYNMPWNPENLSSGVFLYRIRAGNFISVKKLILLK